MTSQRGYQTIAVHILANISQEVKGIRQWNLAS